MQTTLLGIAITIILALITALVGPLFIDWTRYRPQFEAEASRLVGLSVRVHGSIDVRLLPSPSLILGNIEIGGRAGNEAMRARGLGMEFALGPLMRGQFRAAQIHIVEPEVVLRLDQDGRIALSNAAMGFDPNALSIDRLSVEDARLVLADTASETQIVLNKLWFKGDARSLAGAFKGEGAFVLNGGLYGYRVAASRPEDNGQKIKIGIDPSDRPLTAEGEGLLSWDRGIPRFEGSVTLARPVGAVLGDGRTIVSEPVRMTTQVKATPSSALLEQLEIQYGPDDRAIKLQGTAELKFGRHPRLEGVLSARQLDLDRLSAPADAPRRPPLAVVKALAGIFSTGLRPPVPVQLGIGIDAMTLGGSTIQSIRGDLATEGDAWNLASVEFRAPGLTQIRLGGRLDLSAGAATFTGPVDIATADPRSLIAWLDGHGDSRGGAVKSLHVRGDVMLGRDAVSVDRLRADIDRKSFEGRLAYAWAGDDRKARLDADLRAAELDVDGMIEFANAMLGGLTFDRPSEISLAFDVGNAKIAGLEARKANARLKLDADGLLVERLTVADFGGVTLDASGRIDTTSRSPRGNMTLDMDARQLSGMAALVAKFAPQAADPIRRMATRLEPAKLRASLSFSEAAPERSGRTKAVLAIDGIAKASRISLKGEAISDPSDITHSDLRLEGHVTTDDMNTLVGLLGLDPFIAAETRPGRLSFTAHGPMNDALRVEARLAADVLDASAIGTMRVSADKGLRAKLDLSAAGADLKSLSPVIARGGTGALPFSLKSHVDIDDGIVALDDLTADIAGTPLRGRLEIARTPSVRVTGKIETQAIDAAALMGAVVGMPRHDDKAAWSATPFTKGIFSDISGRIEFRTARARVTPSLTAVNTRGALVFASSEIAIENIEGELAGGRVSGRLTLRRGREGTTMRGQMALRGGDASRVISNEGRSVILGRLGLQLDIEGSGLSPRTLIGSLGGSGTISFEDAEVAGLDAGAFAAVMRLADQEKKTDAVTLKTVVVPILEGGRLKVAHADGAITVTGGQARLSTMVARAEGADLVVAGNLDLVEHTIDARMTLVASNGANSSGRPEIAVVLKGPLAAPQRSFDVSALAGWLALRSIERQSKRLEAIETGPVRQQPVATPPLSSALGSQGKPNVVLPRLRPNVAAPQPKASRMPAEAAPLPPPIEIKPAPQPRGLTKPRATLPSIDDGRVTNSLSHDPS